uniref:Uncharacterized protein n=1 Tax=Oryza brachyantha TaxID=4533 RepID=J3KZA2_ORYBR
MLGSSPYGSTRQASTMHWLDAGCRMGWAGRIAISFRQLHQLKKQKACLPANGKDGFSFKNLKKKQNNFTRRAGGRFKLCQNQNRVKPGA